MNWLILSSAAGASMTSFLVLSKLFAHASHRRLAMLEELHRVVSSEQAQSQIDTGWTLYRIDFGYGKEIWVAPELRIDPKARIIVGGMRVSPATRDQAALAQNVIYRT
jgi:hypothetical protein